MLSSSGLTLDAAYDMPGLELSSPMVAASVEPADVTAGSYVNHLLITFTLSTTTLNNATVLRSGWGLDRAKWQTVYCFALRNDLSRSNVSFS